MEDYNEIRDMLKPRRDFAATEQLRRQIESTLDANTRKRKSFRWAWGVGFSCVAAALSLLILLPSVISAKEILTDTLNTLRNAQGIEMTVEIKTRPMENFKYINIADSFVEHSILIAKTDSALTWRIDKGGRTAAGNSRVIYSWINCLNIGWRFNHAAPEELLGEMSRLLTPERILEAELQDCINNTDVEYQVKKVGADILLTVHSRPQGEFNNPYMLNASIAESENLRRYVIDADTKRLKSASVSIVKGRQETVILKITDIIYGEPRANLMELPSGVRFIDMSESSLPGLQGLSATEAASAFLNALETWDVSILNNALDDNMMQTLYEPELKGAVLVSVGQAFNSGNEGITFVPYHLRLPDGTMKRHNLALQKGNRGGWIVIGGL